MKWKLVTHRTRLNWHEWWIGMTVQKWESPIVAPNSLSHTPLGYEHRLSLRIHLLPVLTINLEYKNDNAQM